jgi:hypothetical protein
MKTVETRSTSRSSAGCTPIVLRDGEHVRLVFMPTLVDNPTNPKASVDGCFIYQRKARSGRWFSEKTVPLSTLKAGEVYKLALHAQELRTLVEGIARLYKLHEQLGIPPGQKTFVQVNQPIADLLSRGQKDLTAMLKSQPDEAAAVLLSLIRLLATSPERRETAARLVSMAPNQLPTFTALLGVAAIKNAVQYWKQNQANDSEEFWQSSLAERSYVLSQVFAYPVVVIKSKAYVGGKQLDNNGGKEVDFLLATESTNAVLLTEIKTPQTKLLGPEYRNDVFPLSGELTSSVAQVLRYRQSLMRRFDSIVAELPSRLTLGEPRCVVIAGNSAELSEQHMKENFELQRERMQGVTIITCDELFVRLERLVALLEEPF